MISEGIRCNPNASFLYYNRACFLAITGNVDDAFIDVVRAAKLNPSFIKYAEKDEDLESVRKLPGYKALKKILSKRKNAMNDFYYSEKPQSEVKEKEFVAASENKKIDIHIGQWSFLLWNTA